MTPFDRSRGMRRSGSGSVPAVVPIPGDELPTARAVPAALR